jgi:hypothetical protein
MDQTSVTRLISITRLHLISKYDIHIKILKN